MRYYWATSAAVVGVLLAAARLHADDPEPEPEKPRKSDIHVPEQDLDNLYRQVAYQIAQAQDERYDRLIRPARQAAACAQLKSVVQALEMGWGTGDKVEKFFAECARVDSPRGRGKPGPADAAREAWVRLGNFRPLIDYLERNHVGNPLFVRAAQAKAEFELGCLQEIPAGNRPSAVKLGVDAYTEMLGEFIDTVEQYGHALRRPARRERQVSWLNGQTAESEIDRQVAEQWRVTWGVPWGSPEKDVAGVSVKRPGAAWAPAVAGTAWTRQTLVRVDGADPVEVFLEGGRRTTVPPGPPSFAGELPLQVGPELSEKITRWIEALRSPRYSERAAAEQELEKAGPAAASLLQEHANDPDPEVRLRVRALLGVLGNEKAGR